MITHSIFLVIVALLKGSIFSQIKKQDVYRGNLYVGKFMNFWIAQSTVSVHDKKEINMPGNWWYCRRILIKIKSHEKNLIKWNVHGIFQIFYWWVFTILLLFNKINKINDSAIASITFIVIIMLYMHLLRVFHSLLWLYRNIKLETDKKYSTCKNEIYNAKDIVEF